MSHTTAPIYVTVNGAPKETDGYYFGKWSTNFKPEIVLPDDGNQWEVAIHSMIIQPGYNNIKKEDTVCSFEWADGYTRVYFTYWHQTMASLKKNWPEFCMKRLYYKVHDYMTHRVVSGIKPAPRVAIFNQGTVPLTFTEFSKSFRRALWTELRAASRPKLLLKEVPYLTCEDIEADRDWGFPHGSRGIRAWFRYDHISPEYGRLTSKDVFFYDDFLQFLMLLKVPMENWTSVSSPTVTGAYLPGNANVPQDPAFAAWWDQTEDVVFPSCWPYFKPKFDPDRHLNLIAFTLNGKESATCRTDKDLLVHLNRTMQFPYKTLINDNPHRTGVEQRYQTVDIDSKTWLPNIAYDNPVKAIRTYLRWIPENTKYTNCLYFMRMGYSLRLQRIMGMMPYNLSSPPFHHANPHLLDKWEQINWEPPLLFWPYSTKLYLECSHPPNLDATSTAVMVYSNLTDSDPNDVASSRNLLGIYPLPAPRDETTRVGPSVDLTSLIGDSQRIWLPVKSKRIPKIVVQMNGPYGNSPIQFHYAATITFVFRPTSTKETASQTSGPLPAPNPPRPVEARFEDWLTKRHIKYPPVPDTIQDFTDCYAGPGLIHPYHVMSRRQWNVTKSQYRTDDDTDQYSRKTIPEVIEIQPITLLAMNVPRTHLPTPPSTAPPAPPSTATRVPRAGPACLKATSMSTISLIVLTSMAPAWRTALRQTSISLASAAVCEDAAACPAEVRPPLRITTGFWAAACLRALKKRFPSRTPSM